MLNQFKKLSDLVSSKPDSNQLVLVEAQSYLESEIETLHLQLEEVAENRLPSRKLGNAIKAVLTRVHEILEPIQKQAGDLENFDDWLQLDCDFRQKTLERYATLIKDSASLTPFGTFSEIQKVKDQADPKFEEVLNAPYLDAVKALFCHPLFMKTLSERVDKKIEILGDTFHNQSDLERQKVQLFVAAYEEAKKWNPGLEKNALLEEKMNEMEAIVFLHTQSALVNSGEHQPTEDLISYLNFWIDYLNELEEETKMEKMVLFEATNICSEACRKLA